MISENTKAVLLLTSYFNASESGNYKTLTVNEYGYFACWLNQNDALPVDLFNSEKFNHLMQLWGKTESHEKAKKIVGFSRLEATINAINFERIQALLTRGASLSLALDKWGSAGIWVMDRKHTYYPIALKKQLKHQSPAVLFGIGPPELLNQPGIAFVGSRDCSISDKDVTSEYVIQTNNLNLQVISGAAAGIDSHAMLASLNNNNTAVGVVADSLFKMSASAQWRPHLKTDKLVLITPFNPESRFTPANAMGRNKYIYLLSKAAVVVCSSEKGGTWEGAKENIKKNWVPLFVSRHIEPIQAGNAAILDGKAGVSSDIFEITSENFFSKLSNVIFGKAHSLVAPHVNPSASLQNDLFNNLTSGNEPVDSASFESNRSADFKDLVNLNNEAKIPPSGTDNYFEDFQQSRENLVSLETEKIQSKNTLSSDNNTNDEQFTDNFIASNESAFTSKDETLPFEEDKCEMPLVKEFYNQLFILIKQQKTGVIDKAKLDESFPEFSIISSKAMDKWLNLLIDEGKLIKVNSRKKEYTLP